jgi:hypothetical protein
MLVLLNGKTLEAALIQRTGPGRVGPPALKRRSKQYDLLTKPRVEMRKDLKKAA